MGGVISSIFGGGNDGGGAPANTTTINKNMPEWQEKAYESLYKQAKATGEGKPAKAGRPARAAVPGHYEHVRGFQNSWNKWVPGIEADAGEAPEAATAAKGAAERYYQGVRTAPQSEITANALNQIKTSVGRYEPQIDVANNLLQQQYNTPNERVSTNRFTDPNSIYNQYVEKTFAPYEKRLQQMQGRERAQERHRLSASGYGANDTAMNNLRDELSNKHTDQTNLALAQAMNQANEFFQSDEGRALQAAQANQAAGLQNKSLNMQAAGKMAENILTKYNMNAGDVARMLTGGQVQQGQNQKEINETRDKWNEMNNFDRLELEWYLKFLGGIQPGSSSSSTNATPAGNPPTSGLDFAAAFAPVASKFL